MGISFVLYFTREFKGLERPIECLRLSVQSAKLVDSSDINFIGKKSETENIIPNLYEE